MKGSIVNVVFFLVGALFVSANIKAQEPAPLVQFNNGEIADATAVNNNFSNHEQRIQALEQYQGCSAAQDGSSIVITCADGSSGVLASSGTVVVYPSGIVGEIDLFSYNTGDIVIVDANDEVLGLAKLGGRFQINGYFLDLGDIPRAVIYNDLASNEVKLTAYDDGLPPQIWYLTPDCSGPVWLNVGFAKDLSNYFIADETSLAEELLFESRKFSERFRYTNEVVASEQCEQIQFTGTATRGVSYTPAQAILNAAYPAKLKQLP